MQKTVFVASRNSVYGIFVANIARISTYALWGPNSGLSYLVRTPRKLGQAVFTYKSEQKYIHRWSKNIYKGERSLRSLISLRSYIGRDRVFQLLFIVLCSFVHCSLFIVHCSLFYVHCSLFIVHCSLFIVPLFFVLCSLFFCSLFSDGDESGVLLPAWVSDLKWSECQLHPPFKANREVKTFSFSRVNPEFKSSPDILPWFVQWIKWD